MSWEKHFQVLNRKKTGGTGGTGNPTSVDRFSSYLPQYYAGHPLRIQRYQQYDDMDQSPEVNTALNIISDFCTQVEEKNSRRFFKFDFRTEPTSEEMAALKIGLDMWMKLNSFNKSLWEIFRRTLKYGDQFFIRDPETYEWIWVNHTKVEKVTPDYTKGKKIALYHIRDPEPNLDSLIQTFTALQNNTPAITPFTTNTTGSLPLNNTSFSQAAAIPAEHVIHLSLNTGMGETWPFGTSILEPVFKTYRQKTFIEDAVVIYRIVRAPDRRVFYIDVGDMSPAKAEAYMTRVKQEIRQRRIPSRTGGGQAVMDATYDPMGMSDDYFFAQTADGRGSKVDTLPGGESIGQIDDLRYFYNLLVRGLGVPAAMTSFGPEDSSLTYNDGRVGTAFMQEFNFSKYCTRLQTMLEDTFDREFKLFMLAKGVNLDTNMFDLKFIRPQNFSQYAQMERDAAAINLFSPLSEKSYFSKRYLMKRYLNMNDEDISENMRLWKEENADMIKRETGLAPSELEANDDMSSVGIRNNDTGGLFDDGEEEDE